MNVNRHSANFKIYSCQMLVDISGKGISDDAYYSTAQFCKLFDISRYTVYDLVKNNQIRATKLGGRKKMYFKGSDIKALLIPTKVNYAGSA